MQKEDEWTRRNIRGVSSQSATIVRADITILPLFQISKVMGVVSFIFNEEITFKSGIPFSYFHQGEFSLFPYTYYEVFDFLIEIKKVSNVTGTRWAA